MKTRRLISNHSQGFKRKVQLGQRSFICDLESNREYIVPECLESEAEQGQRKLHVKNTWRIKNSVAKVVNICKATVEGHPSS